jgi:uncharacterized protein YbjT (DUF2867 family)
MTVLVTGANGFVGRHVVARLAGRGDGLRAVVRNAATYSPAAGVAVVEADLTKPETLPSAVDGIDVVVHCAAITAEGKVSGLVRSASTTATPAAGE